MILPHVTAITPRAWVVPAISLSLLGTSLTLLVAGHFFSWDDPQGSQSEQWNYGFGALAGLLATVGALMALPHRTARHLAGAVVAGFVVLLVTLHHLAPDFAFVGSTDTFGLTVWEVGLAMAAFILLTPSFVRPRRTAEHGPWVRRVTTWARLDLYLVLMVFAVPFPIGYVTSAIFTAGHPECGQPGDACLEEYAAWFWALAAWCAIALLLVLVEVGLAIRRLVRRNRGRTDRHTGPHEATA